MNQNQIAFYRLQTVMYGACSIHGDLTPDLPEATLLSMTFT